METHRSVAATMAKLSLAGALVVLCCCIGPACAQVQGQGDIIPYLLVASSRCIYRMELNGTRATRLVCDRSSGIMALDYHYRKEYMYWTNVLDRTIKRAKLDGSNVTKIVEPQDGLLYPAGLAVDWINDKLYWTDRDLGKIQVYDLATGEQSTVIDCDPDNKVLGLSIYPFQGSGMLTWGDIGARAIYTTLIGTTERELLQRTNCPWPLAIDPVTQSVFWSDHCRFNIQSVFLNGTNHTIVLPGRTHLVHFSYGVTLFQESLFWTQGSNVYSTRRRGSGPVTEIFNIRDPLLQASETQLNGMHAVHPFRQPTADQLAGLALCYARGCVNGICQPSGQCSCYPGWAGQSCSNSSETDACAASNGDCQHQCINLVDGYECACDVGFSLGSNQMNCTDVNECNVLNGGCEHQCTNRVGSYECSCNAGFSLDTNGRNCTDANECNVLNGGCEHQCTNTVGSYECSCNAGFIRDSNGRNCTDVNECDVLNGGCEHQCTNTVGSYECLCNAGFSLDTDGRNCTDVNECSVLNGGCEHECTNLIGSYECSCNEGFALGDNERNCMVVDECAVSNGGCEQLCTNVAGGHVCSCVDGFQASGASCVNTRSPPSNTDPEISPSPTAFPNEEPTSTSRHAAGTNTLGIDPGLATVSLQVHPTLSQSAVGTQPSLVPPIVDSTSENDRRNTLIMIIVTVTVGAAVLIGAAVGYAVVLYCKYRQRRTGSWTPKHFERNSNPQRTSFKRITESESTSNSENQSSAENSPSHSLSDVERALHPNSTVDTLSFQWNED